MARRRPPIEDVNAAPGLFAGLSWGRLAFWLFAGIVLMVVSLFSWHLTEEFLIKDDRIRVAADQFKEAS